MIKLKILMFCLDRHTSTNKGDVEYCKREGRGKLSFDKGELRGFSCLTGERQGDVGTIFGESCTPLCLPCLLSWYTIMNAMKKLTMASSH